MHVIEGLNMDDELTVALVGEDKATVKVSFASSIVSAKIAETGRNGAFQII